MYGDRKGHHPACFETPCIRPKASVRHRCSNFDPAVRRRWPPSLRRGSERTPGNALHTNSHTPLTAATNDEAARAPKTPAFAGMQSQLSRLFRA